MVLANAIGIVALRNIAVAKGIEALPNQALTYGTPALPGTNDMALMTGQFIPNVTRQVFEPTNEDWGNYGMFYDQIVTLQSAGFTFRSAGASYRDIALLLEGFSTQGGTLAVSGTNGQAGYKPAGYSVYHERIPNDADATLDGSTQAASEKFQTFDFIWDEGRGESWVLKNAILQSLILRIPTTTEVGIDAQFIAQDMAKVTGSIPGGVQRLNSGGGRLTGNQVKVEVWDPSANSGNGGWVSTEEIHQSEITINTGLQPDWRQDGSRRFYTAIRNRRAMSINLTWLRAKRGIEEFENFLKEQRDAYPVKLTFENDNDSDKHILEFLGNMRMSSNIGGIADENPAGVNTLQLMYNSTPEGIVSGYGLPGQQEMAINYRYHGYTRGSLS